MTNYNERLDEIFPDESKDTGLQHHLRNVWHDNFSEQEFIDEMEAYITSLIKELVAEAKPFDYVPEGHEPDACLNHEKYTSACCGCQRQRARLHALDEFEQSLLKALEEV